MDPTADCEELQLLFSQAALEGGRKSRWPAAILVVGVGCRGGCGWLSRWRLIKTGWGPRTGKTDGRVWCSINTTRHSPAATGCSSGVFIARTPGAAVVDRCAGYWWSAGVQDRRADLTVKVSKTQINRLKVKITTTKLMMSSVFTSVNSHYVDRPTSMIVGFRARSVSLMRP